MGSQNTLNGDYLNLLTLTAATGSGNGNNADLSAYSAGYFSIVTTAFGAGWTPTLQVSPDGGTTWITPATSLIANFAAVAGNGSVMYPLLLSSVFLGLTRIAWTVASTAATAKVFFAGRH